MSQKTDKFIQSIVKGDNVQAGKSLEEAIQKKVEERMRKVLSKQQKGQ